MRVRRADHHMRSRNPKLLLNQLARLANHPRIRRNQIDDHQNHSGLPIVEHRRLGPQRIVSPGREPNPVIASHRSRPPRGNLTSPKTNLQPTEGLLGKTQIPQQYRKKDAKNPTPPLGKKRQKTHLNESQSHHARFLALQNAPGSARPTPPRVYRSSQRPAPPKPPEIPRRRLAQFGRFDVDSTGISSINLCSAHPRKTNPLKKLLHSPPRSRP